LTLGRCSVEDTIMARQSSGSSHRPAIADPAGAVRRADEAGPPLSLRMARSLARSQVYQSAADAPATLRAYKADLANFKAWCLERKLDPMPATPEIVGAYLADAGRGYALSTLRRRVAAIARAHRIAKQPLDTRHPAIRETLRGIARTHGEPPRGRAHHRGDKTTFDGGRDRYRGHPRPGAVPGRLCRRPAPLGAGRA
jgi:hypothetical protein